MKDQYKKPANKRKNTKARKAYASKKSTKTIATVVKKVLNSNEETKFSIGALANLQAGTNLGAHTAFTSGITTPGEAFICLPQIQQGDDDNQRVGNVIQPKSCIVRGTVTLRGTNVFSESVYADIFFMTSKNIKDQSLGGSLPITEMLNLGNGFNGDYNGTSYRAQNPVNKADFSLLKHMRILLQKGANDPNAALSGGATSSTDTFSYNRTFAVSIPLPAKLSYKDATTVYPANYYPFMVAGFHGTDQQGDTAPLNPRIYIQAQAQLYYKDS